VHTVQRRLVLVAPLLFFPLVSIAAQTKPETSSPKASAQASTAKNNKKQKAKHADDFLVKGTVFTSEGLSFPGVEIRIRRSNEKKFRWQTQTNSRGEFAIRVKQGSDYEVVVKEKGFKEQTKTVDAKSGDRIEDMVFRLEREGEKNHEKAR
jgi:hypothetical protein